MVKEFQWQQAAAVTHELLAKFPELDPLAVQLLSNRGMQDQATVDDFLHPDYDQDQHDPYTFRDMVKAVERMAAAVEKGEKIVVHGDYDADGVCGAALLYSTLVEAGANVDVYLPHRDTEGYGLNMHTVQSLADVGTRLIITVDCGISNKDEVAKAVDLGMDVIITDHHMAPPELPLEAHAIINPNVSGEGYTFKFLAGVGVAFKVAQALIKKFHLKASFEKWLLDLVAISTVADYVPLQDENRVYVKYGLVVLRKNKRVGLQKLLAAANMDAAKITTETISYKIAPLINAAGRINHANTAFEMLTVTDEHRAEDIAAELVVANKERQRKAEKMSVAAIAQAQAQKDEFIIIVEAPDWPTGLLGLVAGKVAAFFNRPAFVLTHVNGSVTGSGRSIEHFNMIAALQSMADLFTKYGGHPMACGVSFENITAVELFKTKIHRVARQELRDKDLRHILPIDAELKFNQIDWKLIGILEQFTPFGEGNPEPIFASYKVSVIEVTAVGNHGGHLRLLLNQAGVRRKCIAFGWGELVSKIATGAMIDIAYHVGVNEWNGNREIQLLIQDLKLSKL